MNAPDPKTPAPRSFARRWSRRAGWGSLALALAGGALLFWLLATVGGRDTLLARVVGMLPPGSLTWQRAEGTVYGPLVLHGLRYRQGEVEFTARRVSLDPDVLPVLGRRLQLDALDIEGARLSLPAPDDLPFEWPRWPESLPELVLPIDIRSTRLAIDGFEVVRGGEPVLAISRLDADRLRLSRGGFSVERLALASDRGRLRFRGVYAPDDNYRSDFSGSLVLPPQAGEAPASLQFSSAGDLAGLRIEVSGRAPAPLSLALDLKGAVAAPGWALAAQSQGLQPALFGAPAAEPWAFRLDARGVGGDAQLQGEVRQGGWRVGIEPSRLALADGRLRAQPLLLALPQGPLRITGDAVLAGDAPRFDLQVASEGLRLAPASQEAGAQPVQAWGALQAKGRFDDWTLSGETVLQRGREQATVTVAGHGDRESVSLTTLQADTPTGSLAGQARLRWSPDLGFDADVELGGFDPGYFAPDYPGAVSGHLLARGARGARGDDGRWTGTASLDDLGGQLRGRALAGHAKATWDGRRGQGDASLGVGNSLLTVRGGFGDRYDLQFGFAPLDLGDLLADASGRLQGGLSLRGPAGALAYQAKLQGTRLSWNGYTAAALALTGDLPATGDNGEFEANARDLQVGGLALATLDLSGRGSLAALRLRASAQGDAGSVEAAGSLGRAGKEWRGRIDTLRLAPTRGPALALDGAAAFRYGPDVLQLDRSCLVAADPGGRLCIAATGREVTLDGAGLPLALAQPWLPVDTAVPLFAEGLLDLRATLQRDRAGRWQGRGRLASAAGSLRLEPKSPREVFGYRDLALDFALAADGVDATLSAKLADEGQVSARLRSGLAADSPLSGELQLDVRDLTWLELFSEDLASPAGRLQGRLALAGTRAAPALTGQARLQAFRAELPGLGLKLTDGDFTLVGSADGRARLAGSVRSGEGVLQLDGSLNFRDQATPLQLSLKGEQVTLASTPEFHAVASPDLQLRYLEGRLEVRGSVVVPEARLDLESLDSSVSVSPDVVVLDPVDARAERRLPLDLDFRVSLGDNVRLKGFGLDGRMTGSLALRERPGRAATATGTLQVTGNYRAYGQALVIERARLGYANTPFDNPTLDIRAERDFDEVTVGVQVRGSARRPQTTIVSNPAMETSEALAWLVFGRSLGSTTGNESRQLGAAALALGAGGNLVAQQIGVRLGLDEAGVTDSRNLGGATFTVGKYVSPRLFLSYGISLIGTGQVLTLKYLLRRGFDISIEQGNESAASLNWRTER